MEWLTDSSQPRSPVLSCLTIIPTRNKRQFFWTMVNKQAVGPMTAMLTPYPLKQRAACLTLTDQDKGQDSHSLQGQCMSHLQVVDATAVLVIQDEKLLQHGELEAVVWALQVYGFSGDSFLNSCMLFQHWWAQQSQLICASRERNGGEEKSNHPLHLKTTSLNPRFPSLQFC